MASGPPSSRDASRVGYLISSIDPEPPTDFVCTSHPTHPWSARHNPPFIRPQYPVIRGRQFDCNSLIIRLKLDIA